MKNKIIILFSVILLLNSCVYKIYDNIIFNKLTHKFYHIDTKLSMQRPSEIYYGNYKKSSDSIFLYSVGTQKNIYTKEFLDTSLNNRIVQIKFVITDTSLCKPRVISPNQKIAPSLKVKLLDSKFDIIFTFDSIFGDTLLNIPDSLNFSVILLRGSFLSVFHYLQDNKSNSFEISLFPPFASYINYYKQLMLKNNSEGNLSRNGRGDYYRLRYGRFFKERQKKIKETIYEVKSLEEDTFLQMYYMNNIQIRSRILNKSIYLVSKCAKNSN